MPTEVKTSVQKVIPAAIEKSFMATDDHIRGGFTYVIANNKSYRILKERLLAFQGNNNFIGMDFRDPEIDFVGLAQAFGLKAVRVTEPDALTIDRTPADRTAATIRLRCGAADHLLTGWRPSQGRA